MKNQLTSFEMQYLDAALQQSPQPSADFIQDLENRLDKENRRGGFFFGWFKGMALSLTFLLFSMSTFLNEPQTKINFKNNTANTSLSVYNEPLSQVKIQTKDLPETSILKPITSSAVEFNSLPAIEEQDLQAQAIDTPRVGQFMNPLKELAIGLITLPQLSHHLLNQRQSEPTSRNTNRNREIALYSGVNFTKSYLYSDFNVVSAYDLKLTQSESVLTTTNFGLQLYSYSGQLQWGIGALFTSLGEQANYHYLDYKLEPSSVNPSFQDTVYFEAKYVNKNEYQFIQIPISIGYHFQRKGLSVIPKYSASVGTRVKEQIGYYPNRNGIGMYAFLSPKFNFQQSLQVEFRKSQQNFFFALTPYLNFNSVKTPPEIFSYRKYINFGCNVGVGFRLD